MLWLYKLSFGIEPTQFAGLRIKAKYAKSQKGVKTTKRSYGRDLGKKQNLPERQKWQFAPAMGTIRVAQNTARCVALLSKLRIESMCDFDSLKERHKRF